MRARSRRDHTPRSHAEITRRDHTPRSHAEIAPRSRRDRLRAELDDAVHVHKFPPGAKEIERLSRPAGVDPRLRLLPAPLRRGPERLVCSANISARSARAGPEIDQHVERAGACATWRKVARGGSGRRPPPRSSPRMPAEIFAEIFAEALPATIVPADQSLPSPNGRMSSAYSVTYICNFERTFDCN